MKFICFSICVVLFAVLVTAAFGFEVSSLANSTAYLRRHLVVDADETGNSLGAVVVNDGNRNRNRNRSGGGKGSGNGNGGGGGGGGGKGGGGGNSALKTTGFVRQDFYDVANGQWVVAFVTTLGVCATYDPSVTFDFRPSSTAGVKGFKAVSLRFKSSSVAELTFAYYGSTNCASSPLSTEVTTLPLEGTTTTVSGATLTFTVQHVNVNQRSVALRLLPPGSSGFINSQYYSTGCVDAVSIYQVLGSDRCSNFNRGFGKTECGASVVVRAYDPVKDPTCSGPSTIAFQRPLSCAPITVNGVAVSDLQIYTCV